MRRFAVLLLLVTSCSTLSDFVEDSVYDGESEAADPFADLDPNPRSAPVLNFHYACCSDLCKGWRRVKSILNEADTPYIRCMCTTGNYYRVTRIKEGKKKKR